ncbi:MAG: cytidine deaminase [Planctomycetota bacterium]
MSAQSFDTLIAEASRVRLNAYAPYSRFQVGAALLTTNGSIFVGCNFENASYGLAICAERNAIGAMIAAGQKEIAAMAILSPGGAAPCGACRQVMNEFGPDCEVLLMDADPQPPEPISSDSSGRRRIFKLSELLPHGFGPQNLS